MADFIDPGDVLYRFSDLRTECVSLYGVPNAKTKDIVDFVVAAFRDMGASARELDELCRCLRTDRATFDELCRALPEMCPDAAYYCIDISSMQ
jgi:hypothetical protein